VWKTSLLLVALFSSLAEASYRVYQLKIQHFDTAGRMERTETVITNLDPYQYPAFLGGDGRMKVKMIDTWYCPGDTRKRTYCERPRVKSRDPASLPDNKRVPLPYHRQPVIP